MSDFDIVCAIPELALASFESTIRAYTELRINSERHSFWLVSAPMRSQPNKQSILRAPKCFHIVFHFWMYFTPNTTTQTSTPAPVHPPHHLCFCYLDELFQLQRTSSISQMLDTFSSSPNTLLQSGEESVQVRVSDLSISHLRRRIKYIWNLVRHYAKVFFHLKFSQMKKKQKYYSQQFCYHIVS